MPKKPYEKKESYTDFNELITAVEFGGSDFIINGTVLEKISPTATNIELPDSVTEIADNAFYYCAEDIIIVFKGKNYNYANLNKLKEDVKGS